MLNDSSQPQPSQPPPSLQPAPTWTAGKPGEKKSFFSLFKRQAPQNSPFQRFWTRKKEKREKLSHRRLLRKYLDKAGLEDTNEVSLTRKIFNVIIGVCVVFTAFLLIIAVITKPGTLGPTVVIVGIWTAVFAFLLLFSFFCLYVYLDLRMFTRRQEIEEVLPDFLQLTSANISAGMPLDRALFYAVRPQFGILSKEVEDIAKATTAGEDLSVAMSRFADKYDSVMLRRSVNIIIEGINAGGEMADLLNKIAINIQELRLMKKEMAANVTTYVIFIGFACIVGAPLLFALSTTLATIIQKVVSSIDVGAATGSLGVSFNFNAKAVDITDFKWFSVLALTVTSIFSACIINVIRKGSVKEGWKYIPLFIGATIVLYFIGLWILGGLFSGFF